MIIKKEIDLNVCDKCGKELLNEKCFYEQDLMLCERCLDLWLDFTMKKKAPTLNKFWKDNGNKIKQDFLKEEVNQAYVDNMPYENIQT